MSSIRKSASINLKVYSPDTAAGKEALAKQVSELHAEAVNQQLKRLNCPAKQKLDLLDAVIKIAAQKTKEQV